MKKIIAIILVITMLACNSVNAESFVQDKKVELNNEHMKDYNNSSVKWKFDEKSSVLSFSGCEKLEKVDVGQIKNQCRNHTKVHIISAIIISIVPQILHTLCPTKSGIIGVIQCGQPGIRLVIQI